MRIFRKIRLPVHQIVARLAGRAGHKFSSSLTVEVGILMGGEELISSWGADALRRSIRESSSELSKVGKLSLTACGDPRVLVEADLSTDDLSRAKDRRDFLEERFDELPPLLPLGVEGADATSTSKPPKDTGCDICSLRVHSG